MFQTKRVVWLLSTLMLSIVGLLIVALFPEKWAVQPSTADVCGYSIVPVPVATQRAMQQTMYSADILQQAFDEGRINRDQLYLYRMYLADYREKYPAALKGNQTQRWNPNDRTFPRDAFQDAREHFCSFSSCVQQELNSLVFRSRLQCQQGVRVTITPLPQPSPTP